MISQAVELQPEFKKQSKKAIAALILFMISYIILLSFAIALTAACAYIGISLITSAPRIITIILGVGISSLGFLVLFFLVKFIFKTQKTDLSHLIEITRTEEPELFKIIREIVEEVGTEFPKKIYLTADNNAGVFYDSNFWSMFFPIKKNLHIGLALVNTISKDEFRAILAHEFGHFSQKSMRVGSFVFNINKVIFNMLYDNESYDKMVQAWGNLWGPLSIFVMIAYQITQAIQKILQFLYEIVNKNYLGLSREMEFHADEIAANVTGIDPLKTSLLRFELAEHALQSVMAFYEKNIDKGLVSKNIYKQQFFVMQLVAKEDNLSEKNGLPDIKVEDINKFNKSKLFIENQWESHPSTEDRIHRLEATNLRKQHYDYQPANGYFKDIDRTQENFTNKIFSEIQYKTETKSLELEAFSTLFKEEFDKNSFAKIYMDYYNQKNPIIFPIEEEKNKASIYTIEQLFSKSKVNDNLIAAALLNDQETLKQIINDPFIKIKTFDYDGKKYKKKEAAEVLQKIKKELKLLEQKIKENDIQIFRYFNSLEKNKESQGTLGILYNQFFNYDKEMDTGMELYKQIMEELQFINEQTPFDRIQANFIGVKASEKKIKPMLKAFLSDSLLQEDISNEMRENLETYVSDEWGYFAKEKYLEKNLEMLFTALNNYAFLLTRHYFLKKKELLDYKASLIS